MMHIQHIKDIENGRAAVLFIHGFLGSPRHFCDYIPLVPKDIAIHNILLDGHGGKVSDFSKTSMEKWKNQVDEATRTLIKKYGDVYIAAHSMGTFFACDMAIKYQKNIKGLFLMAMPLSIGVRPTAFVNTAKSLFGRVREDDEEGRAYCESHSIQLTLKLWEYIGWAPRYLELFAESARSREKIALVSVPVRIFQSAKDELVASRSLKYIPKKDNIRLSVLENSAHFIYDSEDKKYLLSQFSAMLAKSE